MLLTDATNVTSSPDVMGYRKISPLVNRYQAVFSNGKATIRDQLDFDALAATINKTHIREETVDCHLRAWLGGVKEVDVWKWNTGENLQG
ncbi:hypothetical protein MAR_015687 [Mya arenaria]|uniref:Uncharacterized protein n=1 Tax=Mya arenaria TaxID=6604 RepID=A0ABY7FM12_MYAAR|nr:hypothetical protein MAR_015687 [Mya arenaria]